MFDAPPFDANISSLQVIVDMIYTTLVLFLKSLLNRKKYFQLMYSKFEYDGKLNPKFVEGPFQLSLSRISAYVKEPVTPR